jgi:UDP-N-acetylmuramoyl-L-alanyl-D-glutamate--2,6-diaminopimelate ligase
MKLGELFSAIRSAPELSHNLRDREVSAIVHDSRKVKPGSLFVAVRGFNSDGHRFIPQAAAQGAVAIVAEAVNRSASAETPQLIVDDSRKAMALLADRFYGHPSGKLRLIGVTGTNGKTTTSYLVKSIIEAAGRTAGLIGTIEYRIGDRVYPAPNTTPESLDLQQLLAEMAAAGATHCVMEVSSHALELGRTLGCTFAAAAFTNLTQDHLDFHASMEAYFEAKLKLFTGLPETAYAVVNLDDGRAADIIKATRASVITTGMTDRAAIHPKGKIDHGIHGLDLTVETPAGPFPVRSPLVGRHNIYNILTAIGIGTALGIGQEVIVRGIADMKAVPGRMEKVEEGQPYGVVVDYAHTEDALMRLLEAVREIAPNRVITLFGCGGDRDRTKRPRMGAAALQGSDLVIVTSDNPRTEDGLSIIAKIESGMTGGIKRTREQLAAMGPGARAGYTVVPDRREAITLAVRIAQPGDVVVLAGKGHEDYQIIGRTKHHFDDREVAREEIRKRQET